MNCIHCGTVRSAKRHDGFCPYNPINLKKIGKYLREYAERESGFNKSFKPFPSTKELDSWFRSNRIVGVKTVRKNFIENGMKLEDWLSELISYGLEYSILDEEEFPIYILYLWDTWLFKSRNEYEKIYKMAIDYEEGFYPKQFVLDFEIEEFKKGSV